MWTQCTLHEVDSGHRGYDFGNRDFCPGRTFRTYHAAMNLLILSTSEVKIEK
jgi:hypothetical protein